ncbi:hypothetical protein [Ferrovibrio sp.]|uniref:hypothetical protein n=1 Tax=Ferrovibrio sp. TaxID=1917215 RepID=UPI00311E2D26
MRNPNDTGVLHEPSCNPAAIKALVKMDERAKHIVDAGAATLAATSFMGWLPDIAALLAVIWTLIRIWETATVQGIAARIAARLRRG